MSANRLRLPADLFGLADPRRSLLIETEGNPCICGTATTMIGPGTETHAGRLDCHGCGKFRTWLPRDTLNFITACINASGLPTESIIYRNRTIQIGAEKMTAAEKGFKTKPNTGALFRNDQKEKDADRDYAGSIDVNGVSHWVSGWIKVSQKGTKYLSLSVKPKEPADKAKASGGAPFNDAVPFAPEWR
jgi:hypothetical protein